MRLDRRIPQDHILRGGMSSGKMCVLVSRFRKDRAQHRQQTRTDVEIRGRDMITYRALDCYERSRATGGDSG